MSSKARTAQRRKMRQQARTLPPLGPGEGRALPPNPNPTVVMPATPSQQPRPGFQLQLNADTSTGVFTISIALPNKASLLHFIDTLLKPRAKDLGIEITTVDTGEVAGAKSL